VIDNSHHVVLDGIILKNGSKWGTILVYDSAHAVSLHHRAGMATVQNVTWDHIDVERVTNGNLGRSWAYFNIETTGTGAGKIRNITVRNIHVRDSGGEPSPINGLDAGNDVEGLWFQDIYMGPTGQGAYAQNAGDARLAKNAFVTDLQIFQTGVRVFHDGDAVRIDGADDWSPGNFKGNCGPGEAVTGMSQANDPTLEGAHALRCVAYGSQLSDGFIASLVVSPSADHFRSGSSRASYDWDLGFAKSECGTGEYVSGASEDVSAHALQHLRCAAAAPATSSQCNSRAVTSDDRGQDSGDWDPGYWKAECEADFIVAGVSVDSAGKPRRILCCHR
jgi:hypothetical protein